MATWVQCTNVSGDTIFVNMSAAASLAWDETGGRTLISYPGDDDPIKVQEKPQKMINAAGCSLSYA